MHAKQSLGFRAARGRLAHSGLRLRQLLRRPSRSMVTNAVALLALLLLTVGEVRGMVAFFSVIGLVVLLRSEHTRARQSTESTEKQPPTELAS